MDKSLTTENSIIINVPVEKVWAALTEPEMIKKYLFGTEATVDWKVGGTIIFRGEWEGKAYEDKGLITAFEPGKTFTYEYFSNFSGLADLPENYSTLTFEVTPVPEGTKLVLNQRGFKDAASQEHSKQNWNTVFDSMKKLLEV